MPRKKRSAVSTRDPAEKPLSPRERILVQCALEAASEGRLLTREALGVAAGFGSGETARVGASRALIRPHVRAALMEGLRATAQSDVADAYGVLRLVSRTAKSARDRVLAARETLDLAGVVREPGPTGVGVNLQITLTDPEAAARFQQLIATGPPHVREGLTVKLEPRDRRPVIEHEEV